MGPLYPPFLLNLGIGSGPPAPPGSAAGVFFLGFPGMVLNQGPPVVLPANFAQAIEALWATSGLNASVGELFEMRLQPSTKPPTNTFKIERGSVCRLSSTSSIYDYRVTFSIRDTNAQQAHIRAGLVANVFDKAGVSWATGWAGNAIQESWPSRVEPKPSIGTATVVFVDEVVYRWRATTAR